MRIFSEGSRARRAALGGIIALLVLAAVELGSACGVDRDSLSLSFNPSQDVRGSDAAAAEAMLQRYLEAVRQRDVEAQTALWTANNKTSARRQADRYAKLAVDELVLKNFHAQLTDWTDHIIVHFDEVLPARGRPVSRAGLLQKVDGSWLIKELR
ncbi:MAG: hypothetical protein EPO21_06840 [Chloroflexota bacterium]|nr:MAG: hypothetical protein EPO21_06840 [Chloroflexota bacterium]